MFTPLYYWIVDWETKLSKEPFVDSRVCQMHPNRREYLLDNPEEVNNSIPFSSVLHTLKQQYKNKVDSIVFDDDPWIDWMEWRTNI